MRSQDLIRAYRILLRLYPASMRSEFAEEMEAVFEQRLAEAAKRSKQAVLQMLLAEYVSVPGEALRARLGNHPLATTWEGPPTLKEMLVILGIFVLPAFNLSLQGASLESSGVMILLFATLLALAFTTGAARGFPRWSLPYLGMALSTISFIFIFQLAADWAAPTILDQAGLEGLDASSLLLLQALWAGLMWLSLFAITFLALGVLALLRRFHPMITYIRQDWTLVSYILYSGAVFTLGMTFNQYNNKRPYSLATSLCLATGAWLYLRSSNSWQRALALIAGLSLAMWVGISSQWPIQLIQGWGGWLQAHEQWVATRQVILAWMWMVLTLLAPALLKLSPGNKHRSPVTG